MIDPDWYTRRLIAATAATMTAVFLAGLFVAFLVGGLR